MFEVVNLTKKFKSRSAISDFSCSFNDGCYGILGPNGAGKTTLMRCILGLYNIDQGKIIKNSTDTIGYLPQQLLLFDELKVYEMLQYFAIAKKVEKHKINDEIERVLDLVNLLDRRNEKIYKLSGGMQRRIGIAQSIIGNPKAILFDEPTAGLDPEERKRFKTLINNTLKHECTILLSSHIVDEVADVSDRIIMMCNGKLLENVTLQEALAFDTKSDLPSLENAYITRLKMFQQKDK